MISLENDDYCTILRMLSNLRIFEETTRELVFQDSYCVAERFLLRHGRDLCLDVDVLEILHALIFSPRLPVSIDHFTDTPDRM
jgi:hypothetical protein